MIYKFYFKSMLLETTLKQEKFGKRIYWEKVMINLVEVLRKKNVFTKEEAEKILTEETLDKRIFRLVQICQNKNIFTKEEAKRVLNG